MKKWLAAAAIALGVSAPAAAQQSIDQLIATLRASPDVANVTTCIPSGARQYVVHLRQAHRGPTYIKTIVDQFGTEAERKRIDRWTDFIYTNINESQEHLYNILGTLAQAGYRDIHAEGLQYEQLGMLSPGRISYRYATALGEMLAANVIPKENEAFIRGLIQDAGFLMQDEGISHLIIFSPKDEISHTPPASFAKYRYVPGADLLRYLEKDIRLLPLEREQMLIESLCTGDDRITMDAREDAALQMMLAYEGTIHIAMMGADHAFGGAQSCPNEDFSSRTTFRDNIGALAPRVGLVEVTTVGLEAFIKKFTVEYEEEITPLVRGVIERVQKAYPEAEKEEPRITGCGPYVKVQ